MGASIGFEILQTESGTLAKVSKMGVNLQSPKPVQPVRAAISAREARFIKYRKGKQARFDSGSSKMTSDESNDDKSNRRFIIDGKVRCAAEPQLKRIRHNGLHVAAIEALVIAKEPHDREYVPDHSALDQEKEIGLVPMGAGDRKLREWGKMEGWIRSEAGWYTGPVKERY